MRKLTPLQSHPNFRRSLTRYHAVFILSRPQALTHRRTFSPIHGGNQCHSLTFQEDHPPPPSEPLVVSWNNNHSPQEWVETSLDVGDLDPKANGWNCPWVAMMSAGTGASVPIDLVMSVFNNSCFSTRRQQHARPLLSSFPQHAFV